MSLVQRYRKLDFWGKLAVWGALASIIAFGPTIWTMLFPSPHTSISVSPSSHTTVTSSPGATSIQSGRDTIIIGHSPTGNATTQADPQPPSGSVPPVVNRSPTPVVSRPMPKQQSKADAELPSLSISLYPKTRVTVGPESKVGITYTNIPLTQYLWLILKTPEGGFWAHGKCNPPGPSLIERSMKTGKWETPDMQEIHFGTKEPITTPVPFTIYAVAVEEDENNRFMASVKHKCANSFEGSALVLEPDAKTKATLEVTRVN